MNTLEVLKKQVSTLQPEEQYLLNFYLQSVLSNQRVMKVERQSGMREIRMALKKGFSF